MPLASLFAKSTDQKPDFSYGDGQFTRVLPGLLRVAFNSTARVSGTLILESACHGDTLAPRKSAISRPISRHSTCWPWMVPMKPFIWLMLFSAGWAMGAEPSGFMLGVNFSEWLNLPPSTSAALATDSSGSLYILTVSTASTVTKLSADGKTLVWQNQLGFTATAMAVDPSGGVYVTPLIQPADTSAYVAKLGASGTGLAWKTPVGFIPMSGPVLAADSQGHAYVAAQYMTTNYFTQTADVVRLNADGSGVGYTAQMMGQPTSIAVDASGAAFVSGTATNGQGVNGVTFAWTSGAGRVRGVLLQPASRHQPDSRDRRERQCRGVRIGSRAAR